MGCCVATVGGVSGGASSSSPIQREQRTTVGAVTEDVLVASVPAAGIVDIRALLASSSYDDGVASEEVSQINTQGFLVNDGVGTVVFTAAFNAPATFGPGVLPPSPALVVVGVDLFCRFTGLAGETIFHQVVWEAYPA